MIINHIDERSGHERTKPFPRKNPPQLNQLAAAGKPGIHLVNRASGRPINQADIWRFEITVRLITL